MTKLRKPCPVTGCTAHPGPGKLMCLYHWRRCPPMLKSAVGATWRAWVADMGNTGKYTAYKTAADQAIAAVTAAQ